MKYYITIFLSVIAAAAANAQYYYLDIIGTEQTIQQYKKLKANGINKVTAASFEANNQPSQQFVLEQVMSADGKQVITHSSTINSGEAWFTSVFGNGNRLVRTTDSSSSAINTVTYQYNTQGKLSQTLLASKDFDGTFSTTEAHTWWYDENGKPEKMLKVKNGTDTVEVLFTLDDSGNVAEETWKRNNRTLETYYYYYGAGNRLTDVVRFNRKARQLLPDFIFEYTTSGQLSQMTQAQANGATYLIWKYQYNDQGLKTKELVYNKQKELLGRIEYRYQ